MEVWKTIPDNTKYEVSNYGVVRNKKTGRSLKPQIVKGYPRVILSDWPDTKPFTVHKLVANAFCDKECEGLQVNHLDGNKLNNRADNLEWTTGSKNINHAYKTGLKKPPCPNPRRVRIVETGEVFDTLTSCAKHINGTKTHIYECMNNIRETHKGYHFEDVSD